MGDRTASEIGKSNVNRSKSHERLVAKNLTKWSGVEFRRRRAEGRGQAVIDVEGAADVIAVNADFKFSVEAKCGAGFSPNAMLDNIETNLFTEWWHQASYDAKIMSESRKRTIYPMLFFRPSSGANWVAIPVSAVGMLTRSVTTMRLSTPLLDGVLWFRHFVFRGYSTYGEISCNVSHSKKNKHMVPLNLDDVVLCSWRDFGLFVNPDSTFESK